MKNIFLKSLPVVLLIIVFTIMVNVDLQAQCPMCKMAAESNLKDGGSAGKGLNAGILYMLSTPYLLIGILGFIWWRNNRKLNEE